MEKAPGLLKIISPTFNNKYAKTHDRGQIPSAAFWPFFIIVAKQVRWRKDTKNIYYESD